MATEEQKIQANHRDLAHVINRHGDSVPVDIGRIQKRLEALKVEVEEALGRPLKIDTFRITSLVMNDMYEGVRTSDLDEIAARICSARSNIHTDYFAFGGALLASNHQRQTKEWGTFSQYVARTTDLDHPVHPDEKVSLLSEDLRKVVAKHGKKIDAYCLKNKNRDLRHDFFGFTTLRRAYLIRQFTKDGEEIILETPQHMWMRISIGLFGEHLDLVFEMYDYLSSGLNTMATPTMLYAGTTKFCMISCFLMKPNGDSLPAIFRAFDEAGEYSRDAGGVGISLHEIRCSGSYIRGTNGKSNGLSRLCQVLDQVARYVDQGGGKRAGAFATYVSPYHGDIFEFLSLAKKEGVEQTARAPNLFLGLWYSDLFVKRLKHAMRLEAMGSTEKVMWTLLDPAAYKGRMISDWVDPEEEPEEVQKARKLLAELKASEQNKEVKSIIRALELVVPKRGERPAGLHDLFGAEFESEYTRLEREGKFVEQVDIMELWQEICSVRGQSGRPYAMFKDNVNRCNAQMNLGAIEMGNLCAEVILKVSEDETACCNLASICLGRFIKNKELDYVMLGRVVRHVVRALNRVIDINDYATDKARRSNMRHRPIGLGVQGLADALMMCDLPYDSDEGRALARRMMKHIYLNACIASANLAQEQGSYKSFKGSPMSKGQFQFDLRGSLVEDEDGLVIEDIRAKCMQGMANSVLVALMPTATSSKVGGNSEAFFMVQDLIFEHTTKNGQFTQVNPHMVAAFEREGMWCPELYEMIRRAGGKLDNIKQVPDWIKAVYKTNDGRQNRATIDMCAAMQDFVDMSMSMNLRFYYDPENDTRGADMTKAFFYAHKKGLKTGAYYSRSIKPQTDNLFHNRGQQTEFTEEEQAKRLACSIENQADCVMCGA